MRTAIFLGLTAIADAINKEWIGKDEGLIRFFAIALLGMIAMDIAEFLKNMLKKDN